MRCAFHRRRDAADLGPWRKASAITDTSRFENERTLENLPIFLEALSKAPEQLGKAPKANGAPHTLVVAGAGLRAADLVRCVAADGSGVT